jgi:uncharacterized iron-regulated membrane protein
MNFSVRNILFQIHLWVGLGLGILFILLGLSGTALMFRTVPGIGTQTATVQASTTGERLPLEKLIAAGRAAAENIPPGASATVVLPREAGEPARIRFQRAAAGRGGPGEGRGTPGEGRGTAEGGRGPGAPTPDILVDPVSGAVLGKAATGMTPFMQFAHDLHGQLLVGLDPGRGIVGWLGVGMTFLALSGIVLWWPKKGQWKNGFIVRRAAKGFRFNRELHGAFGIWFVIVLFIVSFSGVAIVYPEPIRSAFAVVVPGGDATQSGQPAPGRGAPQRVPRVEPVAGTASIGPDAALKIVQQADASAPVQSVTVPARDDQAITVTTGAGRGQPHYVDPYRSTIIAAAPTVQRAPQAPLDRVMGTMRELHEGEGLGPIYWFLVMLSGFLPMLFVITGFMMWQIKRRNRAGVRAEA